MQIKEVIEVLNSFAPPSMAEDFDHVGLQLGDPNAALTNVLVCLDVTDEVLQEALIKKCNLIVSFHPLIFTPLENLASNDRVTRLCRKAIREEIAIFVIHTNLDNHQKGVNFKIAEALGLKNYKILFPKPDTLLSLTTFVPKSHLENVQSSLFASGAGEIGPYSHCSFTFEGKGGYRPMEDAKPFLGEKLKDHTEEEVCLKVVFTRSRFQAVENALFDAHPYETPAYEVVSLENKDPYMGMGGFGELPEALSENDFLNLLGQKFNRFVRHSSLRNQLIKKVAVLGGSGAFVIDQAIRRGADALVTADLKYHDFFKAENQIVLCDVGHFESEQYTLDLIVDILEEKITNFAILKSEINTNPVNYFHYGKKGSSEQ